MKEGRILKSSLNSLKIGYVVVKTFRHSKFSINTSSSKILWVEKCDEVGGLPRKFQSYPLGEASRKIMLNFKTRSLDGCFCQKLWKIVSYFFGSDS